MRTHNLIQGSPEWHAHRAEHFNASDAPAMMGVSPYKTRSELLHEMATGTVKEIDAATQRRFDDGHRFEALSRPLGEQIIGEDLYPVVGSEGRLSASFDGLTAPEDVFFEHKSLNDELRAAMVDGCTGADLPLMYRVQMEQQAMVSKASRGLFMASKWDGDELEEERHCWYESDADLAAKIAAGWKQFAADLAEYQHVEVLPAAVAAPTLALPALSIRVNGSIALQSNLELFGAKLRSFVDGIDKNPSDDQAFADAEAAVKVLEKAQEALEAAESSALAQTASIDEMCRTVAMHIELARSTRLMLEKIVKARKETIRIEIQQGAKDKAAEHIAGLNKRLGKPYMPTIAADFAGVMKGKKTITSLRDAVDTELARFKIEANAVADKIQANLATLRELASEHAFLFADTAQIVLKANDDCTGLIKLRIAEHKAAEEKRLAAERARIAEEERIKAEAKAKAEHEAQMRAQAAEAARQQAERDAVIAAEAKAAREVQEAAQAEAKRITDAANAEAERVRLQTAAEQVLINARPILNPAAAWPAPVVAARQSDLVAKRPAVDNRPPITTGALCELAGIGVSITAAFIQSLGISPAERPKDAKSGTYWAAADVPVIFAALARHFEELATTESALAA
jgi:putative phage-type endonuclease